MIINLNVTGNGNHMRHFFNRDEVTLNDIKKECLKLGVEEITIEKLTDHPNSPLMLTGVYNNVSRSLFITNQIIAGDDELLEDLSNQFYKQVYEIPAHEAGKQSAANLMDLFHTKV